MRRPHADARLRRFATQLRGDGAVTRIAFDEFFDRFPDYTIDESGISRMRASNVRGLANLPIVVGFWTATSDKEALAEPVEDSASKVVTTLAEAVTVIRGMAAHVQLAAKTA